MPDICLQPPPNRVKPNKRKMGRCSGICPPLFGGTNLLPDPMNFAVDLSCICPAAGTASGQLHLIDDFFYNGIAEGCDLIIYEPIEGHGDVTVFGKTPCCDCDPADSPPLFRRPDCKFFKWPPLSNAYQRGLSNNGYCCCHWLWHDPRLNRLFDETDAAYTARITGYGPFIGQVAAGSGIYRVGLGYDVLASGPFGGCIPKLDAQGRPISPYWPCVHGPVKPTNGWTGLAMLYGANGGTTDPGTGLFVPYCQGRCCGWDEVGDPTHQICLPGCTHLACPIFFALNCGRPTEAMSTGQGRLLGCNDDERVAAGSPGSILDPVTNRWRRKLFVHMDPYDLDPFNSRPPGTGDPLSDHYGSSDSYLEIAEP